MNYHYMNYYYIAKDFQMPLFFFFQTMCWLMTPLLIPTVIAIVLRIINDRIAHKIYEMNKNKSVLTIVGDSVLINYKTLNKKILFSDIKGVSSSCTSITRFIFGGSRGFGFALETSNKTYGKIKIITEDKSYVLKYVEFVKNAEYEIKSMLILFKSPNRNK